MPGRPFGWPGTVLRSRIAVFPLSLDLPGDNNPTQSSPKDKNLTEDIENLHIIVCLIRKIQVVKRLGARYYADSAENGPKDWGTRLQLTFLFPK